MRCALLLARPPLDGEGASSRGMSRLLVARFGPKQLALLLPLERESTEQAHEHGIGRLPPIPHRLDEVGREQSEPQDAANVEGVDLLCGGGFLDGPPISRSSIISAPGTPGPVP
jgi:hypothetical protein